MTGYASLITMANFILCGAVAIRFVRVLRHRPTLSASAWRRAWLSWATLFGAALASVLFSPFVQMGRYVGAVVTLIFVIWAYLCCDFAPHLSPRWNWPLFIGLLTIGVGEFFTWAIVSKRVIPAFLPPASSPSILLHLTFLLVIVMRINLPALVWALQHERQKPMRLRFRVMLAPQMAVGVWALTSVAQHLTLGLGLFYNFTPIYMALMIVFTATFVPAYMFPVAYFVLLAQAINHLANLKLCVSIRIAEHRVTQATERELTPIRATEALRSPDQSIYRMVIAILDARKALKKQGPTPAQLLRERLDAVARPELGYSEIVERLGHIGREQLWPLLTAQ